MNLGAVKAALAQVARDHLILQPKLTAYAYTPGTLVAPCFFPADVVIEYDHLMNRAGDKITLTWRLIVGRGDEQSAQSLLDDILSGSGERSLKSALEQGRGAPGEYALGGAADDYRVTRVDGFRVYTHGGVDYIGAEIFVDIIGTGGP